MKKKAYCIECNEEHFIDVDSYSITRDEIKTQGKCEKCKSYICKVEARDNGCS